MYKCEETSNDVSAIHRVDTSHPTVKPTLGGDKPPTNMTDRNTAWCCDWLADQPWTVAMLWLVIKSSHNPLLLQQKIYLFTCPLNLCSVHHTGWQLLTSYWWFPFTHYWIGQCGIQKNIYIHPWCNHFYSVQCCMLHHRRLHLWPECCQQNRTKLSCHQRQQHQLIKDLARHRASRTHLHTSASCYYPTAFISLYYWCKNVSSLMLLLLSCN